MTRATHAAASPAMPIASLPDHQSGAPALSTVDRRALQVSRASAGVIVRRLEIHRSTIEAALNAAGRLSMEAPRTPDLVSDALAGWVNDLVAATLAERRDPLRSAPTVDDAQAERVAHRVVASLAEAARRYVDESALGA